MTSVSCAAAGTCTAGGTTGRSNRYQAFVASQ